MKDEIGEGVSAGISRRYSREVRAVMDLNEEEVRGIGPELRYGGNLSALVWGLEVRKRN